MNVGLRDLELQVFDDSIRLGVSKLTEAVRAILGAQLVAYIGSVRETRAVRQWVEGTRRPSSGTIERLRLAYRAARLLELQDSRETAQAWFVGMNSQLQDESPAKLIREGTLQVVGPSVLAAAREFASAG